MKILVFLSVLLFFGCSESDQVKAPFLEKIVIEDKVTCSYFGEESGNYEVYVFKAKISEHKVEKFIEITTRESMEITETGEVKELTFKNNVEYVQADNLVEFYHSITYLFADENKLEITSDIFDMKTVLDLKNLKSKQLYVSRDEIELSDLEFNERFNGVLNATEPGICKRLEMKDG